MTNYEFYTEIKNTLETIAQLKNIPLNELECYYSHTDQHCKFYKELSGIERIFAQMLFHAQNATLISNIVKFDKNYEFLKGVACGFNPKKFLEKFCENKTLEESQNEIVEALRKGLVWDSTKSKKNKDSIAKRYANTMIECAKYLRDFNSENAVLDDLNKNNKTCEGLISYFMSKIRTGFSVALSADFLKEYNSAFDFPKPDIHIKDVIIAKNGKKEGYYNSPKKEFELINEIIEITNDVNKELKSRGQKPITVYQLDRMIWLVCTENFFLHKKISGKQDFIERIKNKR